jgi:hypothetical protein
MNRFVTTALVIGIVSGCAGTAPTPAPTTPPSATSTPGQTSTPGPTATPVAPEFEALTERFTSNIHGISIGYPSGWHVQPATEPWTSGGNCQECSYTDVIYEQESDSPFIAVASQPLGDSTYEEWMADQLQVFVDDDPVCTATTEQIIVDGSPGNLEEDCMIAFTSAGDRGYLIWLYRDNDRMFFDAILETVDLVPEDAVE